MRAYDWSRTRAFDPRTTSTAGCGSTSPAAKRRGSWRRPSTPRSATSCRRALLATRTGDGRPVVEAVIASADGERRRPPARLPDLVVHWADAAYDEPAQIAGSAISAARTRADDRPAQPSTASCSPRARAPRPRRSPATSCTASSTSDDRDVDERRAVARARPPAALPDVRGRARATSWTRWNAAAAGRAIRSSTARRGCCADGPRPAERGGRRAAHRRQLRLRVGAVRRAARRVGARTSRTTCSRTPPRTWPANASSTSARAPGATASRPAQRGRRGRRRRPRRRRSTSRGATSRRRCSPCRPTPSGCRSTRGPSTW